MQWSYPSTRATSVWMPSNDATGCSHQPSIQWARSSTATWSKSSLSFHHCPIETQLPLIHQRWTRMLLTWTMSQMDFLEDQEWMVLSSVSLLNHLQGECNMLHNKLGARVASNEVQRGSRHCNNLASLVARLSELSASRRNHPEQMTLESRKSYTYHQHQHKANLVQCFQLAWTC